MLPSSGNFSCTILSFCEINFHTWKQHENIQSALNAATLLHLINAVLTNVTHTPCMPKRVALYYNNNIRKHKVRFNQFHLPPQEREPWRGRMRNAFHSDFLVPQKLQFYFTHTHTHTPPIMFFFFLHQNDCTCGRYVINYVINYFQFVYHISLKLTANTHTHARINSLVRKGYN